MLLAEHFTQPPHWEWFILAYFFLAGISGGSYTLGTLLRLVGRPGDEPAVRTAYYVAFATLVLCPILLTIDLGKPAAFWHMLVDTGPTGGLNFKYWSPTGGLVSVWRPASAP